MEPKYPIVYLGVDFGHTQGKLVWAKVEEGSESITIFESGVSDAIYNFQNYPVKYLPLPKLLKENS